MPRPIVLTINGEKYPVAADLDERLLYILRDQIGLTGTKYGCGEGQCGACTVLLGKEAVRSCQVALSEAAKRPITTIEGLERNGQLHPVQQAFIDAGAYQCAYCTSGMIMSSVAFLQENPNPTSEDIVHGLQGNICRCGTYPRVMQAVREAAKSMREGRR